MAHPHRPPYWDETAPRDRRSRDEDEVPYDAERIDYGRGEFPTPRQDSRYGAYGRGYGPYGRRDLPERSWFDRAGDRVSSWLGDDRARRRLDWERRREDDRIRDGVIARLDRDPRIDPRDIHVAAEDGDVTLTGTVYQRYERRLAEDIADSVPGVRHVRSDLRVRETRWR